MGWFKDNIDKRRAAALTPEQVREHAEATTIDLLRRERESGMVSTLADAAWFTIGLLETALDPEHSTATADERNARALGVLDALEAFRAELS